MSQSQQLFQKAQTLMPGGVNSPVRAFAGVGGTPLFIERAEGAALFDVDGNQYIDYVGSWGPMILGHNDPRVVAAITEALAKGTSFGAPCALEVALAQKVIELVPSIERIRMTNSGTEATMSAIRLARGFTGRDNIVKFEGCYHGHGDSFLIKAGSGMLTLGEPSSLGVPAALAAHTFTLPYNDSNALEELFTAHGDSIAAVIVEPIAGNMNMLPASNDFLQALRQCCDQHGAVLIFDEVMTGFRVALGGAQALYQITPDLTTLGKIIGGGLPVGAFGGRADIMGKLAPLGGVYQAGTLSGNPLAMSAGLATLNAISEDNFYSQLSKKTQTLVAGLNEQAANFKIPFNAIGTGGMFGMQFLPSIGAQVKSYNDISQCNSKRFAKFFHAMLAEGIYFAPSAFEAGFVSSAHSEDDIKKTLKAARRAFEQLA